MIRLPNHGSLFAALAGVAFLACVKGEQTSRSADSTARNLTLAPTESTAAMKDVPAAASEPIDASVVSMDTVMKGRGVTKADAAKVAGGAVAGALVGKLLGKNTKGAVIGGAAGAAAGAAAARASRDIDIVIPKGAAITIRLNKPLTVKAAKTA